MSSGLVSFFSKVLRPDVPASARRGEKNVLEGRFYPAKTAQPVMLVVERPKQRFPKFVVARGGEGEPAETGGVRFGFGGDFQTGIDVGEYFRQHRRVARNFQVIRRVTEDFPAQIRG